MHPPRVLSVGQCAFDHGNISALLREKCGAEAVAVATARDAATALARGGYALVLVNRVFDADGASGLDFIRGLKANPQTAAVPVMLVSNYPESQAEAVAAGALPGFGKSALGSQETAEALKRLLQGGGAGVAGVGLSSDNT
jgi:two-component system chemotaxis response regulator CheY